jgi:hypothetical protein
MTSDIKILAAGTDLCWNEDWQLELTSVDRMTGNWN